MGTLTYVEKSVLVETVKEEITNATKGLQDKFDSLDIEGVVKREIAKNTPIPRIQMNEKYEDGFGQALHILGMSKVLNQSPKASFDELRKFRPVHPIVEKNLNTLTEAAGGALMQEMYDSEILPLLRDLAVVRSAGPRIIPMPQGTWLRPRLSGGATAYWRGEASPKTVSTPTFATDRMDAKILTAVVVASDQLLKYGHPATSRAIQDDMLAAIADKEDYTFIRGTGGDYAPMGFDSLVISSNQTAGVVSETPATINADLLKLFNFLIADKIKMVRPAIFMNPEQKYELMGVKQSATGAPMGFAQTIADTNTIYGVPIYLTTNIDSKIYLIEMTHVLLGQAQPPTVTFKQGGGYYNGSAYVTGDATGESVFTVELHEDFGMNYSTAGGILTAVDYSAVSY